MTDAEMRLDTALRLQGVKRRRGPRWLRRTPKLDGRSRLLIDPRLNYAEAMAMLLTWHHPGVPWVADGRIPLRTDRVGTTDIRVITREPRG